MKLKTSNDVDLGSAPIPKLLLMLSLPAITSQLVNALYNMVDRIFIGHIPNVGGLAFTGVGVCFPIIMIISAFAGLIGMGGAPKAGIYLGSNEEDKAEKILGNAFTALFICSIVLTLIILIFKYPILNVFGASSNTMKYASDYITIYAIGTIFVQMTLGMNNFISTQGFAKVSMMTVLIGAITNIILDPILIFGFKLGVKGAALATIISQFLSCLWTLNFLKGNKTKIRLKKENLKIDFKFFAPCIALGVAPFVMQATESLLLLCFNSSLLKYGGDLAVGTMGIISSVMQFSILPIQGLTQGGQPIISYNYGAKNIERIRKAVKMLIETALLFSMTLWVIIELCPEFIIKIFTNDVELIKNSITPLRIYMGGIGLLGAQVACQQCFLAFGSAPHSVFLAIFRKLVLLIPLIYILPIFISNKVLAVFIAEPIADTLAVLVTCTLFAYYFKNLVKYLEEEGNC